MMTVRLSDDTTGTVIYCKVGETVTIDTVNENGIPTQITGVVAEILEDYEPHQ
ncbi:hypothetical protein [Bathymodiolus platifrons methanotrophic gill symbiont]|uniref:hypothetical protein n=1 Tax=Bathymodiolus platifrons methanotrophic gill symbiont TaxID=113268 RepID=UPI00142E1421|nr:hypothetical protein [Bathymodiolus platifrons methanotrophic gill symbiont]MCK5870660.1 hypothetical protein [Methyloprofundus sp.]